MAAAQKRCYYDILSVERNATDDDIRKSYKKLALKLHPDKNHDSPESTKSFAELQAAFEVLIDRQERAWYDKHRNAILNSGDSDYKNYRDTCVDLLPFFSASCYTGLGDGLTEFFTIYRNLFDRISQEDSPFREHTDSVPPTFGDSTSQYDSTVYNFYAYWISYVTPMSYVWKEKYDVRDAMNRREARAAEMDNVKLRELAKRERNERVRTLTLFVRKRDLRVRAYEAVLGEKRREREARVKENRLEQKRHMARMYENSVLARESARDELNGQTESSASEGESDPEALEENYCPACEKNFHNHKTFLNHQRSAKHKENVALLRKILEEHDQCNPPLEGLDQLEIPSQSQSDTQKSSKKSKKKRKKNKSQEGTLLSKASDQSASDNEAALPEETIDTGFSTEPSHLPSEESVKGWGYFDDKPSLIKKGKKAKKSQKTQQTTANTSVPASLVCRICKEHFSTRNKLFRHIEDTGHAIAKS